MKRNPKLNGLVLSVALSAFLVGCGSTASDDGSSTNPEAVTLSGNAVDGYLQYATVCLDLNQDGYCQSSEPSTQTDKDGKFTLNVSAEVQAQQEYEKAMLIVYGGKDVDTGVDFNGKLLAPKDGNIVNITPITTLVAKRVQKELEANKNLTQEEIKKKIEESKQKVALALDIPVEDISKDPVKEQKAGNSDLMKKGLQLQKSVETMLVANSATSKSKQERADDIYAAFADSLDDLDSKDIQGLLDKTFQKAATDAEFKELLGGDHALELADVAKGIASNIETGFENFDEKDENFLEKIGSITKENLEQVKIEYENGTDDIAGQITIGQNIFQPTFDWDAKFIKDDLLYLGYTNPTDDFINQLKSELGDDIGAGVLFSEKEKLKESKDKEVQALYSRINRFENELKEQKEKEEAKHDDSVLNFSIPMSLYFQSENGYEEVTLNENNTMTFKEYNLDKDGQFVLNENDHIDYVYQNKTWKAVSENSEEFSIDASGAVILADRNERVTLSKEKNIGLQDITLPDSDVTVTMAEGAKKSFITIEKTADTYSLDEEVTNYSTEDRVAYTSISDFIQGQCQTNWFMGDEEGGVAFKGIQDSEGHYVCDPTKRSGELVYASSEQSDTFFSKFKDQFNVAGTWEIKTFDNGNDVLIIKPYNSDKFDNHDDMFSYPIFTLKDGKLFRGDFEPKGSKYAVAGYNAIALDSIKETILKTVVDNSFVYFK